MPLTLKPLPYAPEAFEPTMSATTLNTHHGKHHAKYVNVTNELIAGTKYENMSLDELVRAAHADGQKKLFNNAAQVWNHDFFWVSMTPNQTKPSSALFSAIEKSFGSMDKFASEFITKGETHFGSGWVWLLAENGQLSIQDTHDADNPLVHNKTAILTCDVWEHAYYLDTKNDRKAFITGFVNKLANWDHASSLFAGASGAASAA